ncbi:unnamed protein product [[Candida] boidinii]|nr:unnamed protein product [[Candida] boidinii]
MELWWSMWKLVLKQSPLERSLEHGDGDWSSTCGTWNCGGESLDRSRNHNHWNGDWSSTGGDDGLSCDSDWSSTCGTWNCGGQCGNWC